MIRNFDIKPLIASARVSPEAAARAARNQGLDAVILSDVIEGEARDVALGA